MNKFSKIIESVVYDSDLVKLIGGLDDFKFVTYNLGMRDVIDEYLLPYKQEINFNNDPKYQQPLSILYASGKYPEIANYSGKYWSRKLILSLIFVKGNWHPVNKLNTNSFDQAEIIVELVKKEGLIENLIQSSSDINNLKNWLIDFCKTNDILQLIKKHNLKLAGFVKNNRALSERGENAEAEVCEYLINNGYKILYTGGDGDPIDMSFGIDIIAEKAGIISTIQVKRSQSQAINASNEKRYNRIDLFFYSDNGTTGYI